MRLLIIVIYDSSQLQDILTALIKLDVRNAISIDSEGLTHVLAQEVPIFAGLRHLVTTPKSPCKTVLGITDDAEIISKLDRTLKAIGVELTKPETGYAMVLPIEGLLESRD